MPLALVPTLFFSVLIGDFLAVGEKERILWARLGKLSTLI